jgi:hypothetical protein
MISEHTKITKKTGAVFGKFASAFPDYCYRFPVPVDLKEILHELEHPVALEEVDRLDYEAIIGEVDADGWYSVIIYALPNKFTRETKRRKLRELAVSAQLADKDKVIDILIDDLFGGELVLQRFGSAGATIH